MHCNWARFKPQLELEFEFEQLTCPEQLKLATATLFSQLATRDSQLKRELQAKLQTQTIQFCCH